MVLFSGGMGGGPLGSIPFGGHKATSVDYDVAAAMQISPRGIEVSFSKATMAIAARVTPANYTVYPTADPGSPLTVTAVYVYDNDQYAVYLELDADEDYLTLVENYTVEVDPAVISVDGDVLGTDSATFDALECLSDALPRGWGEEPILQAYSDAFGRALGRAVGYHMVKLAQPLSFGDTEAVLSTTLDLPDTGRVRMGPRPWRHFTYTARESHRLTGLVSEDPSDRLLPNRIDQETALTGTLPVGTLLMDVSGDYSFLERARQSALTSEAQGRMLDRVASHGRPPGSVGDDAFRRICLSLEYKERCIWRAVYNLLRGVLYDYLIDLPGRFLFGDYIESVSGVAGFAGCYVELGRPDADGVLVPDRDVFRLQSLKTTAPARAYMEPNATPWTVGWTTRLVGEVADVTVLPFRIEEIVPTSDDEGDGASTFVVRVTFVESVLSALPEIPDLWLNMPDATEDGTLPEHGYLLDSAADDDVAGFPGVYIGGDGIDTTVYVSGLLRRVVPAGCRVLAVVED